MYIPNCETHSGLEDVDEREGEVSSTLKTSRLGPAIVLVVEEGLRLDLW